MRRRDARAMAMVVLAVWVAALAAVLLIDCVYRMPGNLCR